MESLEVCAINKKSHQIIDLLVAKLHNEMTLHLIVLMLSGVYDRTEMQRNI